MALASAPLKTRMNQDDINRLYTILYKFDKAAQQTNVPYWMAAGTALGAVRHGGLIPWDDDGDVYMLEPQFRAAAAQLFYSANQQGLHIAQHKKADGSLSDTWYKVYLDEKQFPNVDIFLLDWRPESQTWKLADADAHKWWPKEYLTPKEIQSSTRAAFGPLKLPLFGNPTAYMERTYGADWNTAAYEGWDHKNEKPIKSEKHSLQSRLPALPTINFQ